MGREQEANAEEHGEMTLYSGCRRKRIMKYEEIG